jgi:hypothetical protein
MVSNAREVSGQLFGDLAHFIDEDLYHAVDGVVKESSGSYICQSVLLGADADGGRSRPCRRNLQ